MDSKNAILILGLVAMVLLISSQVSARDLTDTSTNTKDVVVEKSHEVNDAKYGGRDYGPGGGYNGGGGYTGGGYNGGGGYHGGPGGGYNGGGGYHGGPGGGYNGGGGYHGGGRCRYGCCGGRYGGCRCCSYAGEAVAVHTEDSTRN
ncbi:unnamed protein product [Lathyrus sativus]|nr:unnamed protein product [Lathyrus sativus]